MIIFKMIEYCPFLSMTGDSLGEAHGRQTDIFMRTSHDRTLKMVDDVASLQGFCCRGGLFFKIKFDVFLFL